MSFMNDMMVSRHPILLDYEVPPLRCDFARYAIGRDLLDYEKAFNGRKAGSFLSCLSRQQKKKAATKQS